MFKTHIVESAELVGKRILLIEDDEFIRNVYVKWFSARGAELLSANNGALGLEVLEKHKVDLVLLDLGMPGLNGEETLRVIRGRSEYESLPVLILTNTALEVGDAEYRTLKDLGAHAILEKYQTSLEDLASAVTACFEQVSGHNAISHT